MKKTIPLTAVAALTILTSHSQAQEKEKPIKPAISVGKIEVGHFKVSGFTVGTRIKIDKAYEEKYKFPVPAPYHFIIPKRKKIFVLHPPNSGQASIKLNFATEDKQLIENLQFVSMTIPTEAAKKRLAMTAQLLVKNGLRDASKGFAKAEHLETYQHKIGKCDAVTVHGKLSDPQKGNYFVKLTGIINPESIHSVMAFSMINTANSDVKTIDKLRSDGLANKVIHSLSFEAAKNKSPEK